MNILFISIAWPHTGGRNLYTDLMDEFVQNGHNVYVVGTKNSENHKSDLSIENGIHVLRVHSGQIRKASYLRKIRSLLTLGTKMSISVNEHFHTTKIDLIIAPTPPVTLSFLFRKLKKKFNASFYLLLKDIWPQGSVDLGVFGKYSPPWLYMRSHEKRCYKNADFIGCMSPMGAKYILSKNTFLNKDKVEVCPNSIRPVSNPTKGSGTAIREKYHIPEDACVFIFSGNLGVGHGLHFLVDAIKQLSSYSKAFFVIGGSGTQHAYLEKKFNELKPENAFLYNWLPRDDFNDLMATSDVGLILLYKYTSPQFPSRLLSYLEYSKASLCAVNDKTDIGTIVEESGSGLYVHHGDMDAFVNAVKLLSENKSEREKMGKNGYKLIMNNYTVRHSYEIIMNHFN